MALPTPTTNVDHVGPEKRLGKQEKLASVTPLRPGVTVPSKARRRFAVERSEDGLATAEYAIATLAAVGFAALLVAVLSSGEIRGMLMSLITSALSFG
ncbi:hypothetical protein GCM10027403_10760 [Arthrobacter tecti]